jgi:hypothetical protein
MSACHCNLGLSARAIAYEGHRDHPHDPSDLRRCMDYCNQNVITTRALRRRMRGRSPQWDALLPHWDELIALLVHEMETSKDGRRAATHARMREVLGRAS